MFNNFVKDAIQKAKVKGKEKLQELGFIPEEAPEKEDDIFIIANERDDHVEVFQELKKQEKSDEEHHDQEMIYLTKYPIDWSKEENKKMNIDPKYFHSIFQTNTFQKNKVEKVEKVEKVQEQNAQEQYNSFFDSSDESDNSSQDAEKKQEENKILPQELKKDDHENYPSGNTSIKQDKKEQIVEENRQQSPELLNKSSQNSENALVLSPKKFREIEQKQLKNSQICKNQDEEIKKKQPRQIEQQIQFFENEREQVQENRENRQDSISFRKVLFLIIFGVLILIGIFAWNYQIEVKEIKQCQNISNEYIEKMTMSGLNLRNNQT